MKRVIVEVSGGVASVTHEDDGVECVIIDHDNLEADDIDFDPETEPDLLALYLENDDTEQFRLARLAKTKELARAHVVLLGRFTQADMDYIFDDRNYNLDKPSDVVELIDFYAGLRYWDADHIEYVLDGWRLQDRAEAQAIEEQNRRDY